MPNVNFTGMTLHVNDVEKSLEFSSKIPGASVRVHRPGDFALLDIGTSRLGLLRHDAAQFHIEFETTDLDALYAQLKSSDFPVQAPPAVKPWGERDFLVTDPDGYTIEFGGTEEDWSRNNANWNPSDKSK